MFVTSTTLREKVGGEERTYYPMSYAAFTRLYSLGSSISRLIDAIFSSDGGEESAARRDRAIRGVFDSLYHDRELVAELVVDALCDEFPGVRRDPVKRSEATKSFMEKVDAPTMLLHVSHVWTVNQAAFAPLVKGLVGKVPVSQALATARALKQSPTQDDVSSTQP